MIKSNVIQLVQCALITVLAWRLTHVVMKLCYFIYPKALLWCGTPPEEVHNFGVSDDIFWMMAAAIAFFVSTLVEKRYLYKRLLANVYSIGMAAFVSILLLLHSYELIVKTWADGFN